MDAPVHRVPVGLDPDRRVVRWVRSDGGRFVEPFFDDTLRRFRATMGPGEVGATPLDDWSREPPPVCCPDAVIFHVSRCGSTLVSRMLGSLPSVLSISEAPIVDDILRPGRGRPEVAPAVRERWMRHVIAAFIASQSELPARTVLKLDCWHLFEIDCVRRAFPGVPLLFVYRDPLEVLVSLIQRPSLTLVRDTVTPEEIGISRDARDALSHVEHAAAILGAFFRQAARHREHLIPVPYTSLPDRISDAFPGTSFTAEEMRMLRRAAVADAKDPARAFVPDSGAKRAAATDAERAACAQWARPAYDAWLAVS